MRKLTTYDDRILPSAVQERLAGMRLRHDFYGVNRVVATLDDGTEVPGVWVLWATIVGRVEGEIGLPFEVSRIVDVRHDPPPAEEPDDSVLF